MAPVSFVLFSLLLSLVSADNDWSKPCLSGVCEYDLPSSSGGASGTLKIWGSDTAISDITPAAGWEIINCSPDALQQDVRIVCKDDSSANCAHLYDGTSDSNNAIGKVVRLPENCGKSAFAVVTKSYTPQDQSIPSNISASLTRRDGAKPTVRGLSLDTSFASAPKTSAGPVNFAIRAANVPGANGDLTVSPQQQRRSNSRIFQRGVGSFVKGAVSDIASLNDFNVNKSTTLQPLDVDKSFNLLDQSLSCGPVDGKVKIDVDAKAHAVASIGVAASGTIVPPKVSDFSIIAGLTASIDGTIDMQASASGTIDSGKIKLFEVGIPGLDFPGILTIGPSFVINGQATATLELEADMTIGLSYSIDNAQLTFPPNDQKSSGSFNIGDTPLKLSVSPSAKATGTVVAHLIPTLNFGISALDDTVSANVFLELDASASMSLTAQAQGSASATVDGSGSQRRELVAREPHGRRYMWSMPSLSTRSPQTDDEDGSDDSDDGSLDDGSQDDSSQDDDAQDDDSQDDSSDDSADDTSSDVDDNADDSLDNSDSSSGDVEDGSADGDDSGVDASASADDSSADDNSVENGDDSSNDGSDDGSNSVDNSDGANTDDGSNDESDSTVTAGSDDTSSDDTDSNDDDGSATQDTNGSSDTADSSSSTDDSSTASTSSDDSSDTSSSTDDSSAASSSTDDSSAASSQDPNAEVAASSSRVANTSSGSFGGCFEIDSALDVNAGADGSFFGLFDKNTKVELFSKKFQVLKKCFGSNAAARRSLPSAPQHSPRLSHLGRFFTRTLQARGGLTCPATDTASSSPESIADETVAANQITAE